MRSIKTFFAEFKPHFVSFKDNTFAIRQRTLTGLIYLDATNHNMIWRHENRAFCKMATMEQAVCRMASLKRVTEKDYGTTITSYKF